MSREMFIVARDRLDLYGYLRRTFADAENVQVILDRREGERRRSTDDRPRREEPAVVDRRRQDRRNSAGVEQELRSVGYAFLSIP